MFFIIWIRTFILSSGQNYDIDIFSVDSCMSYTVYDLFCKNYKGFTAAKLNVWLLTSCQTDISNLTGKVLFLAREISKKTEQNRSPHAE